MSDTTLHELCKGFGALLSRSKVRSDQITLVVFSHDHSSDVFFTNFERNDRLKCSLSRASFVFLGGT